MQRTTTRIEPCPKATILPLALLLALVASGADRAEAQTKAYVASASAVTVIDTATKAIVGTVPVGAAPTRVAISRDGSRAYVSNRTSGSVSVIDTATDTVVATIPVGGSPTTLAVTPDGRQVYVMVTGAIEVIDTAQNVVTATIPLETSGGSVSITPDGRYAYVASGAISVIDTATRTIVHSFFADSGSASDVTTSECRSSPPRTPASRSIRPMALCPLLRGRRSDRSRSSIGFARSPIRRIAIRRRPR